MDGATPPPLLTAWLNAATKAIETSNKDSIDPSLQVEVKDALLLLQALQAQIQGASIFSKHEDAEDVVTGNIKYYLCEYYLGMLELKVIDGDRKAHCLKAKHHLTAFLEDADRSGLVAKEDRKALRNDFSDPGQRRLDLLARDKRDAVANKRLEELIKLKKAKVAAKGAEAVEEGEADDEFERETILLTVQTAARRALRELDMTNRELEMLDMRNRVPPSANAKPPAQAKAAAASTPPANSGPGGRPKPQPKPAPVQSTVLQQQASLGKSRQQIINEVFQPGWTQPLYMVEDAVEIDIANGKIVQEQQGKAEKKKDDDDSDDDDNDEKYRKQRAWDDWKDTHPAGSGNRMRHG